MPIFIITGASDGIGAEMARQLAASHKSQASLMLAGRNQAKLDAVATQCQAQGAQVQTFAADLSQEPECRRLVDIALQHFGGIDLLVNNAGVSAQALFADVQPGDLHWYEDLMRINLWGAVWATHAALPYLSPRWPAWSACPAAPPTAPASSP